MEKIIVECPKEILITYSFIFDPVNNLTTGINVFIGVVSQLQHVTWDGDNMGFRI